MTDQNELARIRLAIEAADASLAAALDARAQAASELASLKREDSQGYYELPRDNQVLARMVELVKVFPKASVEPVVREVLSATSMLLAPVQVCYLGPEAAFAHAAARQEFGGAAELRPALTVAEVLDEVGRRRAKFGVVPLETSSDGAITATLYSLTQSDVKICAERTLPSSYHLFSKTGNATDIEKIYGSRPALAACERFLATNFPRATVIDVVSADAAAQFAAEDHGAAVVGTVMVAGGHDLRIVRKGIEDVAGVATRFAIVSNDLPPRTGTDRTILVLAVHDTPGSLHRSLRPFADRNINLTRLESRPAHTGNWKIFFFAELDGHVTDRPVLTAIDELKTASPFVKILGSYPRPV